MANSVLSSKANTEWLVEVLEEVNLLSFHSKLVDELQLTKLPHFDFVIEEDLVQLGMSRPAAKRLLAAVKKRKSFVNSLKNRFVCKLLPIGGGPSATISSSEKNRSNHQRMINLDRSSSQVDESKNDREFGRLTCLINSQDIQIKEEIGNGVHGFVKKGEWTTPTGRVVEVALKILKKDTMSEPGASFNDFVKEISVMHQLNHPNIIKLYGVVLSSPMMMVTELAPFGNLRSKLRSENGSTPISQLINFGVQIASGMAYLESKRFVHRDLAARNIFITHGKKILIGDLGLMRAIPEQDDNYVMSERTKIPYPWCAPESLKYKQFSSSSDVYMFGVTLWEMFSFGNEPWAGLDLNTILGKISTQDQRLPCPDACPTMVHQTLLQCWSTKPSHRPNFPTLYQYLSTSYPLEIISTQRSIQQDQVICNKFSDNQTEVCTAIKLDRTQKLLDCMPDDRILVIDGQPEKYWWKGQNQRTFDIGWFPLSSTRWLTPKSGVNYISRPLKNSFIHTGHGGPNVSWGNPRFIDLMYLRNPLVLDDLSNMNIAHDGQSVHQHNSTTHLFTKGKARSRLSRLFGLNDAATHRVLNHTYHKFMNEQPNMSNSRAKIRNPILRSQSDEMGVKQAGPDPPSVANELVDDGPPLIDLSDDADCSSNIGEHGISQPQQESLIDMDTPVPSIPRKNNIDNYVFSDNQRRASDTRLDRLDDDYHLSWGGSWNTGTFYGSNSNIYSAYYCPQDAAKAEEIDQTTSNLASNRYYSTVADSSDLG